MKERFYRSLYGILLCVGSLLPFQASAQNLNETEKKLSEVETDISGLRSRFLSPDTGRSVEALQKRLQQGEMYYFFKDYLRASIILWDIVEDPQNEALPGYKDALYYLADSLYFNDNWLAARFYFNEIRAEANTPYRDSALLRLVQMATLSEEEAALDSLLTEALSLQNANAELVFAIAKALFFRKRYEEAFSYFSRIPEKETQFLPANYLLGVIRVAQAKSTLDEAKANNADQIPEDAIGRLQEAKTYFQKVLSLTALPSQEEYLDLSHLSLGRIHYELGELDNASKEYLDIGPRSDVYGDARYELAWVYIAQNDLTRAYTTLEAMRLRVKEGQIVAEAFILEGSILSELRRYPEALATYEELHKTFAPIEVQMKNLLVQIIEPREYFKEILTRREPTDAREFLPLNARKWVEPAPLVVRGLQIQEDLRLIEANIEECDEIVALLEAKLNGRSRIEAFPTLVEGRTKGLELGDSLADIRDVTTETLLKDLLPSASISEKQSLEVLGNELRRVESLVETIPASKEDYDKREKGIEARFRELTKRAHKLSLSVDGLSARLVALKKYYKDTKAQQNLSPEDDTRIQEEIALKQEKIRALSEVLKALESEIERERVLVGTNDDAFLREDQIRAYHRKTLTKQEDILAQIANRVAGTNQIRQAQTILLRVSESEQELRSFYESLDEEVDTRLITIKTEVATEKQKLVGYREELSALQLEGIRVASDVIYASLFHTKEHFTELVLRSSVGIIDVAWAMKEKAAREYNEVQEQKQSDLDALHDLFDEALKEQ